MGGQWFRAQLVERGEGAKHELGYVLATTGEDARKQIERRYVGMLKRMQTHTWLIELTPSKAPDGVRGRNTTFVSNVEH
jgi:hypothetical protein